MDKIVELTRSYEADGKRFDTITLREPTYAETHINAIGKPFDYQPAKNGGVLSLTYPHIVDQYVKVLLVEPTYEDIGQLSAVDSMRLESAVCDFFMEETRWPKPPTGSSSVTVLQPITSAE
ncbi:hypothetical protein ASC97_01265 [Rhizobium sp. Root1203]|uniref:phage tail assembly protein n=1 Tax=Rhizobium sp. Root1203 TaxID=1736427 RepID=UPI00070AAFAF|nr:phage tail assembly protein [Rhizobium sp. Root1203]KQV32255.1 hypothetical protein ASC97_01265 [Rhizobium sp. Root1203]